MRPELDRLLHLEWWSQTPGADVHIQSILDLKPTATEREELCALLESASHVDLAAVWAAIMGKDPRPEYHRCLKRTLQNENPEITYHAIWALLDGQYPDALEILFTTEAVRRAAGDRLGQLLTGRGRDMSEEMKRKYLDLFCERFADNTRAWDLWTSCWFRVLEELGMCNERVAATLVRLWDESHPGDSDTKYTLLRAMASCPHPSFEPIFKKAMKSRIEDLRDEAELGMKALRGE